MHWIIIGMKPACYLKLFWTICDVQRFHCQKVCAIEWPVLYPYKNKEICMALFHIRIFSVFTLQFALLCTTLVCGSQVYTCMGHNLCMSQWYLDLLSVSSKSTSVTDFQLWIWHSFWYENLWGYQDNFIYEIACCYIVRIIKIIVLWIILVH